MNVGRYPSSPTATVKLVVRHQGRANSGNRFPCMTENSHRESALGDFCHDAPRRPARQSRALHTLNDVRATLEGVQKVQGDKESSV